jgi:hypothetical protein
MGLDITAYRGISPISPPAQEGDLYFYVNTDFKDQADEIKPGHYSARGPEYRFRAGSYSGYNQWREFLASLVGTSDVNIWMNPAPGPFVELIAFSDCEGLIGPITSAKLAKDFRLHLQDAINRSAYFDPEYPDWFISVYRDFMLAFELASDAGCVEFH